MLKAILDRSTISAPRNRILTVSGYGVRVCVERGHLLIEDGIADNRRVRCFSRATAGFKRLVIIGHSGIVSLDALRWLNDIGASLAQIDCDGNIIVAAGPSGLDDARLRRAQALALINGVGLEISKSLIRKKLGAQADVLYGDFPNSDEAVFAIKVIRSKTGDAATIDALRQLEAQAAGIYWNAWQTLPVRFAKGDSGKLPEHWLKFGSRSSPISKPSPRRAGNPANALLNYAYAILEAEARIAALTVGLDPAIGVMHSDTRARDSLACDLMEPVRPKVDAFVLAMLQRREFSKEDFFETREGVCRLLPSVTTGLAESSTVFTKAVGSVAEEVAQQLLRSPKPSSARASEDQIPEIDNSAENDILPTPLTQSNRSNGKNSLRPPFKPVQPKAKRWRLECLDCGKPIDGKHRSYCNACLAPIDVT